MPQLLIHSDSGESSYLTIEDGAQLSIGRRRDNDLCLPQLSVSGYHALIAPAKGCLVIEDLQSTNGTFVNGEAIRQQVLVHLDDIIIGSYRISYSETFVAPQHSANSERTTENRTVTQHPSVMPIIDPSMVSPSADTHRPPAAALSSLAQATQGMQTHGMAAIKVASGELTGNIVELQKPLTTVGKTGGDLGAIAKKPTGYYFLPVHDRSAPMTHNGKGLQTQVEVKLMSGDIIEIGGEKLEFLHPYFA